MAEVIPFRGIFYNTDMVDSSLVVAPPYDTVTPTFKEVLYARSPYNIIHVDLGMDMSGDNERENRYTRAKKLFNQWLKKGILISDTRPSFYCYAIDYRINEEEKRLIGFLGVVKIEELGKGSIRPHEMTYSKPKADRMNILRFCMANISPIFSLYSGRKRLTSSILKRVVKGRAFIEAKDEDGFLHRLWKINDRKSIETIKEELSDKDIFIADGHHRYETALEFRNEMNKVNFLGSLRKGGRGKLQTVNPKPKPWDYVMMFLANMEDDGLTILPTHRLIGFKGSRVQAQYLIEGMGRKIEELLKPYFEVETISLNLSDKDTSIEKMFKMMRKSRYSLGMFIRNKRALYVLKFKGLYSEIDSHQSLKRLDVTILHELILKRLLRVYRVEYEMDAQAAIEKVNAIPRPTSRSKAWEGMYHAVFFLNPIRIEDVKKVALAGERMPPKSTYFYPKLLTGMVIYKF